ncbi:MAG: ComEC/Rec2 family competence protein [Planctomycetota bacterium]
MARLQIDMLPVGDSDALLVEYQEDGTPVVALIDGGRNWEDGNRVVRQLEAYYGGQIDHLVLTHLDVDHARGLIHIVETLGSENIGQAWVPDLGNHGVDVERAVQMARTAAAGASSSAVRSVAQHVAESVEQTTELLNVLRSRGVPVKEAFAGDAIGPFEVLGPTEKFFTECVEFFDDTQMLNEMVEGGVAFRRRSTAARGPAHHDEVLASAIDDPESDKQASLILLLRYGEDRYLFTGDAGRRGMKAVGDREKMRNLHWLKVPNHGSKHNLDPQLLDLFRPALAYVSASGVGIDPHPALLEALEERGSTVYTTAGSGNVWHHRGDVPPRTGYQTHRPR